MRTSTDTTALSIHDVSERLGVHYMTAYRYVRSGQIQATQVNGQWRVETAAVDSFQVEAKPSDGQPVARRPRQTSVNRRAVALAEGMLDGDEAEAWRCVQGAIDQAWDPRTIYLGVVSESLRIIGDRWESGSVSIAEEHRASVIAMRTISGLGVRYRRRGRKRGSVVLAAAPGDRHGLPTAVLADLLRLEGFRVTDLGADVPASQLPGATQGEDRLFAVGVCATTSLDSVRTQGLVHAISLTREVVDCPIVLGGAAIESADHAIGLGADLYFSHTYDLLDWFSSKHAKSTTAPPSIRSGRA